MIRPLLWSPGARMGRQVQEGMNGVQQPDRSRRYQPGETKANLCARPQRVASRKSGQSAKPVRPSLPIRLAGQLTGHSNEAIPFAPLADFGQPPTVNSQSEASNSC
ncbi:unnamed protein product [Protopolystoma xenopodis]|uniref:Uncharacterized protein n=1 Tax=Protopolystoma xenopodis TaxID=117903 RepID=A0A3S4ZQV8_9PLAT|nr:unnamed protein product [Protopolystoma xenopodis]